jgi:hypothetical protein
MESVPCFSTGAGRPGLRCGSALHEIGSTWTDGYAWLNAAMAGLTMGFGRINAVGLDRPFGVPLAVLAISPYS